MPHPLSLDQKINVIREIRLEFSEFMLLKRPLEPNV